MIFVEYDKTTKEVVQTTSVKPASHITANTKIMCVDTDTTVWNKEDSGVQEEGVEALLLPTAQTMPSSLEDLRTMALEYVRHVFQEENQEFASGGSNYPSDQETRVYIIGIVASAQAALYSGDNTWTNTRINTEGVATTFTATEFISHAQDMETDLNSAYQLFLQREAALSAADNAADIYSIIEPISPIS